MAKISRLSFNSGGWQRPTGDASRSEAVGTYNRKFGFGHEDWLFRNEWQIAGWRYAFIQGVNKSRKKLVKAGHVIDLTLFTIQRDKRRRLVAKICGMECLDDRQAEDALEEFRRRGWYDTMLQEVQAVGGDATALGAARWASHVLNVRFRLENVILYPRSQYIPAGNRIFQLNRYMLYDFERNAPATGRAAVGGRLGSTTPPRAQSYRRGGSPPVECSPEHARMQAKLMSELRAVYPEEAVQREENFIDVSVRTPHELILFEIKSDLEPRSVIRQALGQILEYAYHPRREHSLPVRLVIVGRGKPLATDQAYLNRLKADFRLPIEYRVLSLS